MVDEDIISADEVISAEDGMAETVIISDDVSIVADELIMAEDISAEEVSTAGDELITSAVALPGA